VIHLVTDSTSDLVADEAAALGVRVVPLTVRFGAAQFRDGVDLGRGEFYRRLADSPVHPSTSQPSPREFTAVYSELLRDPEDSIVSIHISEKLSGTLGSAHLAARDVDARRIHVVDSESVTVGLQLIVEAACRDIAAGMDAATVVRNVEQRRARTRIFFLLDTLTYLHRGGRIGRAQAFVGGVLKVKPMLSLHDGEVHPQARVRSRQQGLDALAELARAAGPLAALRVVHAGSPHLGAQVRERLELAYPQLDARIVELGPVVGTYSGPAAVGIACLGLANGAQTT
jgi:DegV family protein with EDD domain